MRLAYAIIRISPLAFKLIPKKKKMKIIEGFSFLNEGRFVQQEIQAILFKHLGANQSTEPYNYVNNFERNAE